jgi:hypothetical protein
MLVSTDMIQALAGEYDTPNLYSYHILASTTESDPCRDRAVDAS